MSTVSAAQTMKQAQTTEPKLEQTTQTEPELEQTTLTELVLKKELELGQWMLQACCLASQRRLSLAC
jgi:hypothetical protein